MNLSLALAPQASELTSAHRSRALISFVFIMSILHDGHSSLSRIHVSMHAVGHTALMVVMVDRSDATSRSMRRQDEHGSWLKIDLEGSEVKIINTYLPYGGFFQDIYL